MPQVLDTTTVARETVEAFNEGAWDRFASVLDENSTYDEMATHRHCKGCDEIVALNKEWKGAFPDAQGTIERLIEAGDTVTMEVTWRGHHTGPLQTPDGAIPPTGRAIEVSAAGVLEIREGKVVSDHHYFDLAGMFEQLGVGA